MLLKLFRKSTTQTAAYLADSNATHDRMTNELEDLSKTLDKVVKKAQQREEEIIKKVSKII